MSIDVDALLRHPLAREIAEREGAFLVRAPGRVNLIGEHTDYNGLPVLPMAIDRDICIIARPIDEPAVRLRNIDPAFEPREFAVSTSIPPYEQGDWGNYAKAAAQAIAEWSGRQLNGFAGLVCGDIPTGAGLSSSSAMVVASALAILRSNGLDMPKSELAELLARGERYVGTQGGGMDQTVSLMAEAGKALKIDFFPIRVAPGDLPFGQSVVVCNSLIAAEKAGKARDAYNTRVVECKIGLALLQRILAAELRPEFVPNLLGDLLLGDSGLSLRLILDGIEQLPEHIGDVEDAANLFGLEVSTLTDLFRMRHGSLLPVPEGGFKVRSRCRHIFTEALRVEQAVSTTDAVCFGGLMNDSHGSCAIDYEISCPELDALVGICRESGALGARLTGAGFGGCAIALVPDECVPKFISAAEDRYYGAYIPRHRQDLIVPKDLSRVIFACKPSAGASVLPLSSATDTRG
jgi:N-acetylgalactosamine kinase